MDSVTVRELLYEAGTLSGGGWLVFWDSNREYEFKVGRMNMANALFRICAPQDRMAAALAKASGKTEILERPDSVEAEVKRQRADWVRKERATRGYDLGPDKNNPFVTDEEHQRIARRDVDLENEAWAKFRMPPSQKIPERPAAYKRVKVPVWEWLVALGYEDQPDR